MKRKRWLMYAFVSLFLLFVCWSPVNATSTQDVKTWMDSKIGKSLDFDGSFGYQCVDFFNYYLKEVWGISSPIASYPVSYAYQIFDYNAPSGWSKIYGSGDYRVGDVVIWNKTSTSTAGHVGLTEGSHCVDCNTVIIKQEEIALLAHNYVDGVCKTCGQEDPSNTKQTDTTNNTKQIMETGSGIATETNVVIQGVSNKIAAGKTIQLTIGSTSGNIAASEVVWTTSNSKLAIVDSNGKVTIKAKSGGKTVTITATAKDGSGKKVVYKIKIMKHVVKSLKLKAAKSVKAGKKTTVKAVLKTTGSNVNKRLKWTSSNTKYATVSSKGVVKTKKAGKGKTVKITAITTDGSNKKKTVKIKIK